MPIDLPISQYTKTLTGVHVHTSMHIMRHQGWRAS
uniref:Uncharacterized protein n=1 Tax=Timema poppense TaxID=170557 RepID=A0A7R9DNL3_TIMPO|nr:unnamed protein product [Timema poppensis]